VSGSTPLGAYLNDHLAGSAAAIEFDPRVTGSEHLSRLMETEGLAVGVEGKLAGWQALKVVSGDLGIDLDALIERAADQRRRLEPFRIDAAARAFS
jgi:hypothetical protein